MNPGRPRASIRNLTTRWIARLAGHFGTGRGRAGRAAPSSGVDSTEQDERLFRELAGSIDLALLLYDLRENRFAYVSPAFERLTGIAPNAVPVLGLRLFDIIHPQDRIRLDESVRSSGEDAISEAEFRIRHADGTVRWVRVRSFPVRTASGPVTRRAVLMEDIGARRQAETERQKTQVTLEARLTERTEQLNALQETLRAATTRFNEAQQLARLGSWELDLVTNRLVWSDEIFRIFEIDPYVFDASYEAFLNTVHPEDRDQVDRAYTESVRSKTPYEIVHRLLMRDGRVKHVRERGETLYDSDGHPRRSVGTVQDVTAQVQARQERDRAQSLLATIMDSSPDWIFVKDLEHRFLMVNQSFAAGAGVTPPDMIGRPDTDFWSAELCEGAPERGIGGFHPDDHQAFLGRLVHNPEDRVTLCDGRERIFDTYKGPLRDVDGRIYGVLGYSRDVTERRQAEQALRAFSDNLEERVRIRTAELAAERHFTEALLHIVGALVVVLDREGRIVRFNRACELVTGYSAAEVIGSHVWDFLLLPEEREAVRNVFSALRDGCHEKTYENIWLTRDGRRRTIAWSNTVMMDTAGTVEYVVGTGLDVTERKAAEAALRTSEETLRQMAENIQEIFFVRDLASNRMVYVSPSYDRIWGRPRSALYQDPADFLKSVHPDDLPKVKQTRDQQNAGHGYFSEEYRVQRPDGSVRWVWARTFPIPDADGRIYRVAGLVQDLTERKLAEQELAANEAQFRQMAENISGVVWLVSPDRRTMHYVSPAFEQVWGYRCSELYANPKLVFDTIHPDDRAQILAELAPQLRGEFRDHYDQEYRIRRGDGQIRWLHSRYRPVRDPNGQVYRLVGIAEDVTERKLSEENRLRQAREQRDTLVREVHHRIKNNLQGVVGLLRQHASEFPVTREPLEMAIARIQSMALVFGLRSDAGTQKVLLCQMIGAICRAVTDLTGVAIEPQVERHIARPIPVAQDEAVPLALILNELVFNAVKHQSIHAPRQPVSIDIRYMDGRATVTIRAPGARLPAGFDFDAGHGLGSGLQLVRSLLPRPAASLALRDSGTGVDAELTLVAPVIIPLAETVAKLAEADSTTAEG